MPAATTQAEKLEREARAKINLNAALKVHVLKERQRKKEEHEAEVEEERLRKEREARERQDVMTLGETREQINKLEMKLNDLKNEKQSLFLQLKKVLNEDENRKKQQQQKDSELFAQMHPTPHAQVFLPPRQQNMNIVKTGIKRARSPSPPPGPQNAYYKGTQYSPKIDDGRRGPDVSRVLWKQPPGQYQNPPGTLFYQTTANPPQNDGRPQPIIYPAYTPIPLRQTYLDIPAQAMQQHAQQKNDITQMGHVQQSQQHKPSIIMEKIPDRYHVEVKIERPPSQPTENVVYAPLIHQNIMQQSAKAGVFQANRPPNNQQQLQQQQIHYPRRLF